MSGVGDHMPDLTDHRASAGCDCAHCRDRSDDMSGWWRPPGSEEWVPRGFPYYGTPATSPPDESDDMSEPVKCPNPYCDGTGWIRADATGTANTYCAPACTVGPHPSDITAPPSEDRP